MRSEPDYHSRGGEFGRYKGLTLHEIRLRLDQCTAEPSRRSLSAVMRLVREQLDSRGHLAFYRTAWLVVLPIAIGSFLAWRSAPEALRETLQWLAVVSGAGFALVTFTNAVSWRAIQESEAHKRVIREWGREAIREIAAVPGAMPETLTLEQSQLLKELRISTKQ
ncbi:MAG: hypothetical protein ACOYON_08030 [Fimbriimonas sp.]